MRREDQEARLRGAIHQHCACHATRNVDRIAGVLGRDGEVLMPLDAYDFSPRFTWVNDRFGVSWQIMAAA